MNGNENLERRINAALKNRTVGSADLSKLIATVEVSIASADQTATEERARALDLATPNPRSARDAAVTAELTHDRLEIALRELRDLLGEALAREARKRLAADFARVEAQLKAAAEKFASYPELVGELVDIFQAAAEVEKEIDRVNAAASAQGEPRRLRSVELTARGLSQFSRAIPSIAKELRLPDWEDSGRMAWPPPQVPFAVAATVAMFGTPSVRAVDWRKDIAARDQRRSEDAARVAAYYENQSKEQEARQK